MDTGAILTTREAQIIIRRLNTITRLADDRRIKEQARMIGCDVNKAARRASRNKRDMKLF